MSKNHPNAIHTRIWQEESEDSHPFVTKAAYCAGYDVYGEMLGHARWADMIYLLFRGDAPEPAQADLLDALAVALANPGPRDPSVHAAMCGGVCGSTSASTLMAALAVGAGQLGGGREVFCVMQAWHSCGTEIDAWREWLTAPPRENGSIWPEHDHPPGFDPRGGRTATPVMQTLLLLSSYGVGLRLQWLEENRLALEEIAARPLALSSVAAAALADLGFTPEQGEMMHLLLRLPGAAVHALEQRPLGYKKFPFGTVELEVESEEGKA